MHLLICNNSNISAMIAIKSSDVEHARCATLALAINHAYIVAILAVDAAIVSR